MNSLGPSSSSPSSRPTPASVARAAGMPPYDRPVWTGRLMASGLPSDCRLVGLVLAHLAGPCGTLPAGGMHTSTHIAGKAGLKDHFVRVGLSLLETEGYLSRPSVRDWLDHQVTRPITLTLPPARRPRPAPAAADRRP